MRCLTSLFIILAGGLLVLWVLLPAVAGGAVTVALGAAGLSSAETRVTVSADPPLKLLGFHADLVHVTASNATFQDLSVAALDVSLSDVALLDRRFATIDGTLSGVQYAPAGGATVTFASVRVGGSAASASAAMSMTTADLRTVAARDVRDLVGAAPATVTVTAPDRVSIVAGSLTMTGRLAIDAAGGIVLRWGDAASGVGGTVDLVRPRPGFPLRFRSFSVTPTGLDLVATVDLTAFGG